MRQQEVSCFAEALGCDVHQVHPFDFLHNSLTRDQLDRADIVFVGGSGHYGAVHDAPWLDRALDGLREIHRLSKPTFGSCWGFQAMSRALGGTVIKDLERAEVGTQALSLTSAGSDDPIFGPLGSPFFGQMGHEDRVTVLPDDAILLASSDRVTHQAYRLQDKPIYCTQFHPELTWRDNRLRFERYMDEYGRLFGQAEAQRRLDAHRPSPEANGLLKKFHDHCVAGAG